MMQDILEASPDMEYVTSACTPLARIQLMLPSTLQRLGQHWATFTYSLTSRDTKKLSSGCPEICISHGTVFASSGYEELTLSSSINLI